MANNLSTINFGYTILLFLAFIITLETILILLTDLKKENRYLLLFSLFISLIAVEAFLKFGQDNYKVYSEINEGFYSSRYTNNRALVNNLKKRGSYKEVLFQAPNSTQEIIKKEFQYTFRYNELGLPDQSIDTSSKDTTTQRIIALGDSFTEGIGAPQDSSWVNLLELKMNKKYPHISVDILNAGKAGNDPIYSFEMLKNLLHLQPNLVLLAINETELGEIQARGGINRFENGQLNLKTGPWWEVLYASSFIVRYYVQGILNYDYDFNAKYKIKAIVNETYSVLIESLKKYIELAKKNNFAFMVILQPHVSELYNGRLILDQEHLASSLNHEIGFLNLIPCMGYKIKSKNELPSDYYWKLDAHCNSKGYNLMAECLMEMLAPPSEKD